MLELGRIHLEFIASDDWGPYIDHVNAGGDVSHVHC